MRGRHGVALAFSALAHRLRRPIRGIAARLLCSRVPVKHCDLLPASERGCAMVCCMLFVAAAISIKYNVT